VKLKTPQSSLVAFAFLGALVVLFIPGGSVSHEPVTTKIRFNKEVVRIFQKHCLACHTPRSTTNVVLNDFASARPWARAFKEEILERRMPPFQAVKGFGSFHNDYTLTQHEIDQIVSWVEGGAPKGDEKDLPGNPEPISKWQLGTPDLELAVKTKDAGEYRCVSVPTNLNQTKWLTAIDFHPNDEAVHCAAFQLVDEGVDCSSANGDSLGQWVPGTDAVRLPDGAGQLLRPGSKILVRMHQPKSVDSKPASLGLYFSSKPVTKAARVVQFQASTNDSRVVAQQTLTRDAEAVAIRPLLFPTTKSMEAAAYFPDGSTEVLIWVMDYKYDWQPSYQFRRPVFLPKGTRIEIVSYLDKVSADQPLRLAEVTLLEIRRRR
jgi:hypothetical protein